MALKAFSERGSSAEDVRGSLCLSLPVCLYTFPLSGCPTCAHSKWRSCHLRLIWGANVHQMARNPPFRSTHWCNLFCLCCSEARPNQLSTNVPYWYYIRFKSSGNPWHRLYSPNVWIMKVLPCRLVCHRVTTKERFELLPLVNG